MKLATAVKMIQSTIVVFMEMIVQNNPAGPADHASMAVVQYLRVLPVSISTIVTVRPIHCKAAVLTGTDVIQ